MYVYCLVHNKAQLCTAVRFWMWHSPLVCCRCFWPFIDDLLLLAAQMLMWVDEVKMNDNLCVHFTTLLGCCCNAVGGQFATMWLIGGTALIVQAADGLFLVVRSRACTQRDEMDLLRSWPLLSNAQRMYKREADASGRIIQHCVFVRSKPNITQNVLNNQI